MTVVSFQMLEELKQTWLRQITCIFYSPNHDVNIDLLIYSERNALLCELQGPTLSQPFFAASLSTREKMDVCLELLFGRFSVCPAANAVFSVLNCGLEDAVVSDL